MQFGALGAGFGRIATAGQGARWFPLADEVAPSWFLDYAGNRYINAMATYASFSNWLTALGGTYSRASTAMYYNSSGVLTSAATNTLRFDYDPVTLLPKGILLEGERTNLVKSSGSLETTTNWSAIRASLSLNATTSPDGTANASKLVENDSASTSHMIYQNVTKAASAIQYTASLFVKAAERTFVHIRAAEAGGTNVSGVGINLSTGEVGTPYGSFTSMSARATALPNGWYHLEFTFTTLTGTTVGMYVYPASSLVAGGLSYSGDGSSGVYVWGAQLEAGAFASSYIPTTTATVTRAADVLTFPTSPWLNNAAGTLLFDFIPYDTSVRGIFSIQVAASATSNRIDHRANGGSVITVGGVGQLAPSPPTGYVAGTSTKIMYAYSIGSSVIAKDGTNGTSVATAALPVPDLMKVGNLDGGGVPMSWHIRKIGYWPLRVTDAELERLTT